jgi:formylglycine-generating enzyme required for sulfatase activity
MHRCRSQVVLLLAVLLAAGLCLPQVSPLSAPPEGMVRAPAGEFVMGKDGNADWSPAHKVRIRGFFMDKQEVTNAMYLRFCKDTGHSLPEFWGMEAFHSGPAFPDHPVTGVNWRDAKAYAEWAGKRLPTEAEWEYAARGGLAGMDYPNGNTLDEKAANFSPAGKRKGTVPVCSYAPNRFGLCDMAGNVNEWVADFYSGEYYKTSPAEDPRGPAAGRFHVIRGGDWHSGPSCNRVFYRNALPENWVDFNVGFRCAKDIR